MKPFNYWCFLLGIGGLQKAASFSNHIPAKWKPALRNVFTVSKVRVVQSLSSRTRQKSSVIRTQTENSELYLSSNHSDSAEEMKQKAMEIREEVRRMEAALENSRFAEEATIDSDNNELIHHLFGSNRPLTPEAIARVFKEERWSVEQAESVLQSTFKRHRHASELFSMDKQPQSFQVVDTDSAYPSANQTEIELLEMYMQCILNGAAILDQEVADKLYSDRRWPGRGEQALRSRMNEWRREEEEVFKRQLAVDVQAGMKNETTSVENYMRQSLGLAEKGTLKDFNASQVAEQVLLLPLWVPSSLVKLIVSCKATLAAEDIKAIKDTVLQGSRFFCTSSDSISAAAIFRGNMRQRSVDPSDSDEVGEGALEANVFAELQELMNREELSSRVQLFLMPDPEWKPGRDADQLRPKPVILAVPRSVAPDGSDVKRSLLQKVLRRATPVLAVVTSFAFSISCYALNSDFFDAIVHRHDITVLLSCLPVFFGVLAVQGVHEMSHYIVAKRRGIKIGKPSLIPSTQIGIFGCITPLRSFPKDRSTLLDVSLSGPVAGLAFSLFLMATGIHQTVHASQKTLSRFPVVPVTLLKSSFLSASLFACLAPKIMMLPLSQPIPIHPFFMVGFSGLFASALNLLPVFRLDGGRACSAATGPKISAIASAWTLLLLLSAAMSGTSKLALVWGAFILFFQRRPEIPVRNDVTEVSDLRLSAWLASLATSIMALFPFPGAPGLL